MSDYIKREDALEICVSCGLNEDGVLYVPLRDVTKHLKNIAAADVREIVSCEPKIIKRGKAAFIRVECPSCLNNAWFGFQTANYCPQCGSKWVWPSYDYSEWER